MKNQQRLTNVTVKRFNVEGLEYKLWLFDNHEFILDMVGGMTKKGVPKKNILTFWGDEPEDYYEDIHGDLKLISNPFKVMLEVTPALVNCVYQRKLQEFGFAAINKGRIEAYTRYAYNLWENHFQKRFDLTQKGGSFRFTRREEEIM